jgi:predicted dehydrogenase
MLSPLRTALIGPGKVADTHARALQSLSNFVAVCGRDPAKTKNFADHYNLAPYTDLSRMLDGEQIDALVVTTPHPQHAPDALVALERGVHTLVEKPMAITLADCDRMLEAAARHNAKLGVISQRRLYEPVQRVRAAIDAGKIGEPALGIVQVLGWRSSEYYEMDAWRGTWEGEGGGVMVNQAVHQLDLYQWLMGPIVEVSGYWANLNHPTIEVEDTAVASVRFKSGALGSIILSNSQKPGLYAKIHIHGRNGASVGVQTEGGSMFISGIPMQVEPAVNDLWTIPGEEHLLDEWTRHDRSRGDIVEIVTHYHYLQIQDFIESIEQDRAPVVDGIEGRKSVELFTAIYRSQAQRSPISFPLPN